MITETLLCLGVMLDGRAWVPEGTWDGIDVSPIERKQEQRCRARLHHSGNFCRTMP